MPTSKLRQAAILVATLDRESADALLDQMSPAEAARVRAAVMDLDDVAPGEQEAVIQQFMGKSPRQTTAADELAGVELDQSLAAKLRGEYPTSSPPSSKSAPFRFLHQADGETLFPFLRDEHPQTVAVVVSHLPPRVAADLITRFEKHFQVDVLRRVAELDQADPDSLRQIETQLHALFTEQMGVHRRRSAGLRAVGAILQAAEGLERREILTTLAQEDAGFSKHVLATENKRPAAPETDVAPRERDGKAQSHHTPPPPARDRVKPPQPKPASQQPASQLPASQLRFRDISRLDDTALALVLGQADTELALLALAGADETFTQRLMKLLSPREARQFEQQMQALGPIRLSDVDRAQNKLAVLASQLLDEGKIAFPAAKGFAAAA